MRKALFALGLCACSVPQEELAPHQPARLIGAREVGPVDPNEVIDLVIGVRLRAPEAMRDRALDPTAARMSPSEIGDTFAASAEEYARGVEWAREHGLEIVRTTPSRTTLTVRGTAEVVERAFGTELRNYADDRGSFRAPSKQLWLARELGGLFDSVVGLDDAARYNSRMAGPPKPIEPFAGPGGALEPADFKTRYNITASVTERGDGETVAILGTGFAPRPQQDVDAFITRYTLGSVRTAQYNVVSLGGPNRDPDTLAQNEYQENVLDIDMVLAFAPKANVVHVVTATNTPGLFNDGIVYIINNVPQAHAVSVSYGSCERFNSGEILPLNTLFLQAKLQGQTWFFASGDNGTDGCRDGTGNKVLVADWPASSPWVIGVGGTELSGGNEVCWSGSGGAESEQNPKPPYQQGISPYPNNDARMVPDVSALAGAPGVTVMIGNSRYAFNGTSASAPMWAGVWALLHQRKASTGIKNAHERLYQLGNSGSTAFRDVTMGMNKAGGPAGFSALPGYDLCTGWGVPNIEQLLAVY
jgi:kumamolisin